MSEKLKINIVIPNELSGLRVDLALSKLMTDFSRTQIQEWIKNGEVTLEETVVLKNRYRVKNGDSIAINATKKIQPVYEAEDIKLNIIFEDKTILVIDKPAGMVVHPAAGNYHSTLLNALLHHSPELKDLPRAGIIHRLDKNTSGLLVIAKNQMALKSLTKQLKARTMKRIYQAIVSGTLTSGGTIDQPIGRHPIHRLRMAVVDTGKSAITHYRIIERYAAYTRIKVQLETGRTHQIRVHFAYIHHPLLGDPTYGGRLQLPKGATPELIAMLRQFKRQALHASELELQHPLTQKMMVFQSPLPHDLQTLIHVLQNDKNEKSNDQH